MSLYDKNHIDISNFIFVIVSYRCDFTPNSAHDQRLNQSFLANNNLLNIKVY